MFFLDKSILFENLYTKKDFISFMGILKRHKKSSVLFGVYFLWWAFVIYYCFSLTRHIKPTCDFSPIGIVFLSLLLGLIFSLVFLIKALTTKEPIKTEYLIFLGIATLPLVLGGIYVMSNS